MQALDLLLQQNPQVVLVVLASTWLSCGPAVKQYNTSEKAFWINLSRICHMYLSSM